MEFLGKTILFFSKSYSKLNPKWREMWMNGLSHVNAAGFGIL